MLRRPAAGVITFFAQLWGAKGFHDDDCELVSQLHDVALVDWTHFRGLLSQKPHNDTRDVELKPLIDIVLGNRKRAREQCPLGFVAACLTQASASSAENCVEAFDLTQVLASRWPLADLLAAIQAQTAEDLRSCDDLPHPSINWGEFRYHATEFARDVPPWLSGLSENDTVPESFNIALGHAQGIVWKGSSGAIAHGRTIMEWTSDCELGLLTASAIRAAGVVLSDGDVYRIAQRAIEGLQFVFRHVESLLRSPWPLFGLMHVLSLLKKTLHDTRFLPVDLAALDGKEVRDASDRSPIWHTTASMMRKAGNSNNMILMTGLPWHRVNFFQPFLKRANALGFLRQILVVPGLENITSACREISEDFVTSKRPDVDEDWSPCLPFVSQFPERAQFLYIHVALQLSLTVMWFDFHVFWVQSPLPWIEELTNSRPLPYHDACIGHCNSGIADIFAADDFYAAYWPRQSLLLLRPTEPARQWVDMLIRWICTYPYANAKRGVHYLLHPDVLDAVPSMSMLPDTKRVQSAAPVVRGELDAEQKFASTDGWFGSVSKVVSFEIGYYMAESDRVALLDRLYTGADADVFRLLETARKTISPLRPTQRLLDRVSDSEECTWQPVPGAYLGDYAADIETVYESPQQAQCVCLELGLKCAGITCESVEFLVSELEEGKSACTLRKGEPWLTQSPIGETSYVKVCESGGCDAKPIERVVHVNFADGCCEAEQKQSSETALEFGASESRPLRGDFLDSEFRAKNHVLLTFNRTPELTQHKTPSGKIGYYVWKPYVVLRTLEDPALPWDTTVVAWTDAGIHFVSDMRPLIDQYMRVSDVAATRTPMLEGDFSKRDAFILLDADYQTIIETNQVATGFILARKTPLAIQFLRAWLQACEDRRIMTEEPSILGAPDYFTFKNNNDDQTAFSLLFKKYGFRAFSVGERDSVVYTGRNLAKFVKASDDFAVGRESSQDDYLKAADDAASARA